MMTPGFDPTREPDLTLIDTVVAEDAGKSKKMTDLPIPESFKEVLTKAGLEYLLPIQNKVVDAGLFNNVSMLIVSSTSSGKTLLGELAGIPKAMKGKKMMNEAIKWKLLSFLSNPKSAISTLCCRTYITVYS